MLSAEAPPFAPVGGGGSGDELMAEEGVPLPVTPELVGVARQVAVTPLKVSSAMRAEGKEASEVAEVPEVLTKQVVVSADAGAKAMLMGFPSRKECLQVLRSMRPKKVAKMREKIDWVTDVMEHFEHRLCSMNDFNRLLLVVSEEVDSFLGERGVSKAATAASAEGGLGGLPSGIAGGGGVASAGLGEDEVVATKNEDCKVS